MADKWKDLGPNSILDCFIPPREHAVKNTDTGEIKVVVIGFGQTVGEAITKGQWKKD